jgi:hypothetical protein
VKEEDKATECGNAWIGKSIKIEKKVMIFL